MSYLDPSRPAEERIQAALVHGPDVDARGRFGAVTRIARRFIGRAVKYERDFTLQVDRALLDKVHEVEARTADELRTTADGLLRDADVRIAESGAQLREADDRARRDLTIAVTRIEALQTAIDELRSRVYDVDRRAGVATTLAEGAAQGFESLTREVSQASDRAGFVYEELTSRPFVAEEGALVITDADGRSRLGYRGGAASAPLYMGFEEVFRGSESAVRERQRVYLDVVAGRGPVVDLGCGRGEMLGLLASAGIEACGVDLDEAMVDRARASGANVEHGDALDFLVKQEDGSLGAVFCAQFVEHLPAALLPELLEIARSKLQPHGLFVAETVNPHSPRALKAFWVDPTHRHPLFPESMLALCRLTGFEAAEIIFPRGGGDLDTDLRTCGEYAVVAGARDAYTD